MQDVIASYCFRAIRRHTTRAGSTGGLRGAGPGCMDRRLPQSGGIHGHPDGTVAGAKAVQQAVDAFMEHISVEEYAEDHDGPGRALEEPGHGLKF